MSIPPSNYPSPGGQPPYGAPTAPVNGTMILILGILSLVVCGFLGPVAWIMGNNALASGNVDPSQAGSVNAGRICGMIASAFLVLGLIWFFFLGGLAMVGAHHAATTPYSAPGTP